MQIVTVLLSSWNKEYLISNISIIKIVSRINYLFVNSFSIIMIFFNRGVRRGCAEVAEFFLRSLRKILALFAV